MTNSARRSPPDYPVPGQDGTARWRSRQWCGTAMLVPTLSAHIDPLPSVGRPAPAPAAIVVAGVNEGRAEGGKTVEAVVTEEEGVAANERPAVPAAADKAWPDGRMREARAAEGRSAKTSAAKVRPAHATDMHAAEAASVHCAAKSSTVHPAAEPTTVHSAAESTTATASTAGEYRRSDRQRRSHGCCDDAGEKSVVHWNILLAVRDTSRRAGRIRRGE